MVCLFGLGVGVVGAGLGANLIFAFDGDAQGAEEVEVVLAERGLGVSILIGRWWLRA